MQYVQSMHTSTASGLHEYPLKNTDMLTENGHLRETATIYHCPYTGLFVLNVALQSVDKVFERFNYLTDESLFVMWRSQYAL